MVRLALALNLGAGFGVGFGFEFGGRGGWIDDRLLNRNRFDSDTSLDFELGSCWASHPHSLPGIAKVIWAG